MREKLFEIIESAIELLNEELDYESLEDVGEETPIFGGHDGIDSLSLIVLITDIEKRIKKELGVKIILADESAMARSESPYSNVGNLLDFAMERLEAIAPDQGGKSGKTVV